MASPLHVSHAFPFSAERWLEVFFDPGFTAYLRDNLDMDEMRIELLEDRNDMRVRTVKVAPRVDLPTFASRLLKAKRFSYLETSSHRRGSDCIDWLILPSVIPDKFTMSGKTIVESTGERACRRTMSGEISIKLFGIGPRLEETIAEKVCDGYNNGHKLMIAYEAQSRQPE